MCHWEGGVNERKGSKYLESGLQILNWPFFFLFCGGRPTVCWVAIRPPPLRRRDDKQNDPNKYCQQNRQGDWSAKSGQNPNQTLGQQTQNPNQGDQQSGGQQREPQR